MGEFDEVKWGKFGVLKKHLYKLRTKPEYHDVLRDLQAFTGLSMHEVCKRVLFRKNDKGHVVDELKWHSPFTDTELSWFYRSCQGYLFINADRKQWDKTDMLSSNHGPVLEYGGGIGNTAIGLAKRGIETFYIDVSLVQTEFVKFRAYRHKVWGKLQVIDPVHDDKFDPLESIGNNGDFGTIIVQDVLEHVPAYEKILIRLISCLRHRGRIIEYCPFNTKERNSPVHLEVKKPISQIMKENLMLLDQRHFDRGVWIKK